MTGDDATRQQHVRSMPMGQLQWTIYSLLRSERIVHRAVARYPESPDQVPVLRGLQRDIDVLIGETVRRMPDWEWEAWADWRP